MAELSTILAVAMIGAATVGAAKTLAGERPRWHLRCGAPVHRPFIGVEFERLGNGHLMRVSLWPQRYGFYVRLWKE